MAGKSSMDGKIALIPGGCVPGSDLAAFAHASLPDLPVVIAAPHGGRAYPEAVVEGMRDAERAMLRLEDRYVDRLATSLAEETGANLIVAHAPRAMLDLNRAPDDMDWEMVVGGGPKGHRKSLANRRSRSGLGLVPRRLPNTGEIWKQRLTRAELDKRIGSIHQPYHQQLGKMLDEVRDRWGAALLIDLHSMPPLKRRFPDERAPEFVLGDRFGASCDGILTARALDYFGRNERGVAHNRPYAGGYVLDRHALQLRGIHALQLEVCRTAYLDAQFSEPSVRMPALVRLLSGLVRDLAACTATLGRDKGFALAAE